MNRQSVQTALIGVGGFGSSHLRRLLAPPGADACRLVAVADPCLSSDAEKCMTLKKTGCRIYLGIDELLQQERALEAVIISTPIPLHEEMTISCMDRGLHVLLEKPPVPLLEQLDRLVKRPGHEKVAVAFQRIASRPVQLAKQWIMEGRLGQLVDIRASACWPRFDEYYTRASWAGKLTWAGKPVFDGPATNALSHVIHNMMFLAGAKHETFTQPVSVEAEFYRVRPTIESYDLVCMRGSLATGPQFHAALTHACHKKVPFVIELKGTRGWIRLGENGTLLEASWGYRELFSDAEETYERLYNNFVDLVHSQPPKAYTSLEDTRGFLMTTSGGLSASGGIHAIDSAFVRRFEEPGKGVFEIEGLPLLIQKASEQRNLFSEMGVAWASCDRQAPCAYTYGL